MDCNAEFYCFNLNTVNASTSKASRFNSRISIWMQSKFVTLQIIISAGFFSIRPFSLFHITHFIVALQCITRCVMYDFIVFYFQQMNDLQLAVCHVFEKWMCVLIIMYSNGSSIFRQTIAAHIPYDGYGLFVFEIRKIVELKKCQSWKSSAQEINNKKKIELKHKREREKKRVHTHSLRWKTRLYK